MKLLFVRHGQTDSNAEGLIQGRCDPPLNRLGLSQAHLLIEQLKGESFSRIISSPLKRAHQTAEVLASAFEVPLELDDRLVERDFGLLQDQPYSALFTHPVTQEPDFFRDAYQEFAVEPIYDMMNRVQSFLDDLARQSEPAVLIVAHGGIGYFLEQILRSSDAPHVSDNGQVHHFELHNKKE